MKIISFCRSHWPRRLWSESVAFRFLWMLVRILPGAWMSLTGEYCVSSGRGLYVGLITHPEESYWLWCV